MWQLLLGRHIHLKLNLRRNIHVACLVMPLAPVEEMFPSFSQDLSHAGRVVYMNRGNSWWGYLGVGKIQWYWFIFHKVYFYSCIIKVNKFPWLNNFWKTLHSISLENSMFICIVEALKNLNSGFLHLFCFPLPFIFQMYLIIKCFLKASAIAVLWKKCSRKHFGKDGNRSLKKIVKPKTDENTHRGTQTPEGTSHSLSRFSSSRCQF